MGKTGFMPVFLWPVVLQWGNIYAVRGLTKNRPDGMLLNMNAEITQSPVSAPVRSRKNQPAVVRSRLLEVAGKIAINKGVANVTLDAVAQGAGVSKGGLLHHFRSKRILLDEMFLGILDLLAARVAGFAMKDSDPFGRFTRAYLMTVTNIDTSNESRLFAALSLAMTTDLELRQRWQAWLKSQMALYGEMEDSPELWIVQYAADGLWMGDLTEGMVFEPAFREKIIAHLFDMTRAEVYFQRNKTGRAGSSGKARAALKPSVGKAEKLAVGKAPAQNKDGKPKAKL